MNDDLENENLPMAVCDDDGFADGDDDNRIIKGSIYRCTDGVWTETDGTLLPPGTKRIVLGVTEVLQRWLNQRPVETIATRPFPDLDQLNDAIPKDEWELGLDGNPRAPWTHQFVVYLLNPADASISPTSTAHSAPSSPSRGSKTAWA